MVFDLVQVGKDWLDARRSKGKVKIEEDAVSDLSVFLGTVPVPCGTQSFSRAFHLAS